MRHARGQHSRRLWSVQSQRCSPRPFSARQGEPGDRASRLLGQTIGEERKKFVDYILRCRAQGYIAFDDDPFEIVSLFVAMAQGEWSLRLGTGMLAELTDEMIEDHAQRVTRIFLKGLAP